MTPRRWVEEHGALPLTLIFIALFLCFLNWLRQPVKVTYTDEAFRYVGPEEKWDPTR